MKKKSFDLASDELEEFDNIVSHSGLSQAEYIRNCVLPSRKCRVIFIDGAAILAKLGELYELVKAGRDNSKAYSDTVNKLFAEFVELYKKIDEYNSHTNGKGE